MNIFISYRRIDTEVYAGRVFDSLSKMFGRGNIFIDFDKIYSGEEFEVKIKDEIARSQVFLVLIGPKWVEELQNRGGKIDYVKLEIETALEVGCKIIPVLIDQTDLPSEALLPESLKKITNYQVSVVRKDSDFQTDVEKLSHSIHTHASGFSKLIYFFRKYHLHFLTLILFIPLGYYLIQHYVTEQSINEPIKINADPDGLGSDLITYEHDMPNLFKRSPAIQYAEIKTDVDSKRKFIYVTLKPEAKEGWLQAIHTNRKIKAEYIIQYTLNREGLISHNKLEYLPPK